MQHQHLTSIVSTTLLITVVSTITLIDGACLPGGDGCPAPCFCPELTTVDCSSRKLKALPETLPYKTEILLASDNEISKLHDSDLDGCHNLRRLQLSFNKLQNISSNSLLATASLQELYLNNNNLDYDLLPDYPFKVTKQLEILHLHKNVFNTTKGYRERFFSGLENVKYLTIDAYTGVKFGPVFKTMEHLDTLHVYGKLAAIENDTFEVFQDSHIHEISIKTGSKLRRIEGDGFAHFRELQTLDLGYNQDLEVQNISWWGLQNTNISKLILSQIVGPQGFSFTSDFCRYLNLTNITTLLIDRNNIVNMEPVLSKTFPNLEYLDMSYNRLSLIARLVWDIKSLINLKYWDISHQSKRFPSPEGNDAAQEYYSTSLESSYGSDTPLKCESNPSTFWTNFDKSISTTNVWCIPLPPQLEAINLTECLNLEIDTLPTLIIFNGPHLKYLEFSSNAIRSIPNPMVMTTPCQLTLDLSGNGMKCSDYDSFKYSRMNGVLVTEMLLSGNNLASQLSNDAEGRTFKYFDYATTVDLSHNSIKSLPFSVFRHLSSVVLLNLSSNALRLLEFEFKQLVNLTMLDLSYNLITTLNDSTMLQFTVFFKNADFYNTSKFTIDLTGNPLQCSCDTLAFLRWTQKYHDHLTNFEIYKCWFNSTYVPFSKLENDVIIPLSFQCSLRLAIILSVSLCALALVIIGISTCTYRYRWELRYWCLWLTQRSKLYHELVDDTEYEYDAFVVYSGEDGHWVNSQLVPNLEGTCEPGSTSELALPIMAESAHFKLCVHERDFKPGEDIIGNIWMKMQRSRKVVLVISSNFAVSNYCDYEMNLARMQSVEKGRNVFVPIILEPLDIEAMSDGLRWIVRKLTYIEWPVEEHRASDRHEFWQKVREALVDGGLHFNYREN